MVCPVCGEDTRVVDSRPNDEDVLRWRKCTVCKYRFKTVEVDADLLKNLIETCGGKKK